MGQNYPRPDGNEIHNFEVTYCRAPEQICDGTADEKADIWAAGITLYVMLGGYPPFRAKNQSDLKKKIMTYPVNLSGPEWRDVSKSAKQLIRRMLHKNPQERISATEALSGEWISKFNKVIV